LGSLIELGLEAVVVFGPDLTVLYANDEALRILGYRWEDIAGIDALSLVHPDDLERAGANVSGVVAGARPDPGLIRLRVADGSWWPVEVNPRHVELPDPPEGPGSVMAVTLRDHRLEDTHWRFLADLAAGRDIEASLESFAQGLSGPIDGPMGVALHVDGELRTVGPLPRALIWPTEGLTGSDPWSTALATGEPAWAEVTDLPVRQRGEAESLGVGVVVVVPVPDPAQDSPALMVQCPYAAAMGPLHTAALAVRPRQAVAIGLDRRHALARLEHLAHHDPLTGLANRSRFFDLLNARYAAGQASGVCYLDLDRFKAVNDTYGHHVGDEVLRIFTTTLRSVAPAAELIARLGGDEFAVVCGSGDVGAVSAVAAGIVEAFRAGVTVDDLHHDVNVSAGVAVGTDRPDVLVAAADAALYTAKRSGRARWHLA